MLKCSRDNKFFKIIILCATAYTLIFLSLKISQYYAFFSFEWEDEARNNQMVWNTAHGVPLYETIFGGHLYGFSGHLNPILLIISLAYVIFPHIFTWYFLSIGGIAFSSIIVYKLGCMVFDDELKSFSIALIYLLYPPLHYLNFSRINTITFFIPLALLTFYYFKKEKFLFFIVSAVLAMMCMESVSLYIILFGVYAAICKKSKKWIFVPFFLGITWFFISTWVILPSISNINFNLDTEHHQFHSLDRHTFCGLIKFIIFEPKECLLFMFSKSHSMLLIRLLYPLIFIPLFSIAVFIGIPGFLQVLFMHGAMKNQGAYYIAGIIPFFIIGYVYGLARIEVLLKKIQIERSIIEKISYMFIFGSIILCIITSFGHNIYGDPDERRIVHDQRFLTIKNIFNPLFYKLDRGDKIAWEMIRKIPQEASVSASGDLLVPLSHRKKLLEFGNKESNYNYFDAEYIMLNKKNMFNGAGHYSEIKDEDIEKLNFYVSKGKLKILMEKENFLLLKNIQ